jgi:flagellar biosynthesis protein FliP
VRIRASRPTREQFLAQFRTSARRAGRATAWILAIVFCIGILRAPEANAQTAPVIPADPTVQAPQVGDPSSSGGSLVQTPSVDAPADPGDININVDGGESGISRTVAIVLLLTVASVAPSILLLTTCFTRFVIVLSLTRNAIGAQQLPPTQVLVSLALFLTIFVMRPIFLEINKTAVQPALKHEISTSQALKTGFEPLKAFMLRQTDEKDLSLFVNLSGEAKPENPADVPATTVIPAYVISELRSAFVIGFVIFIPFLIIDLVASSILMSMGMVMLPPVFISLPLKLLLFILVDGWNLVIGSVVRSVHA